MRCYLFNLLSNLLGRHHQRLHTPCLPSSSQPLPFQDLSPSTVEIACGLAWSECNITYGCIKGDASNYSRPNAGFFFFTEGTGKFQDAICCQQASHAASGECQVRIFKHGSTTYLWPHNTILALPVISLSFSTVKRINHCTKCATASV